MIYHLSQRASAFIGGLVAGTLILVAVLKLYAVLYLEQRLLGFEAFTGLIELSLGVALLCKFKDWRIWFAPLLLALSFLVKAAPEIKNSISIFLFFGSLYRILSLRHSLMLKGTANDEQSLAKLTGVLMPVIVLLFLQPPMATGSSATSIQRPSINLKTTPITLATTAFKREEEKAPQVSEHLTGHVLYSDDTSVEDGVLYVQFTSELVTSRTCAVVNSTFTLEHSLESISFNSTYFIPADGIPIKPEHISITDNNIKVVLPKTSMVVVRVLDLNDSPILNAEVTVHGHGVSRSPDIKLNPLIDSHVFKTKLAHGKELTINARGYRSIDVIVDSTTQNDITVRLPRIWAFSYALPKSNANIAYSFYQPKNLRQAQYDVNIDYLPKTHDGLKRVNVIFEEQSFLAESGIPITVLLLSNGQSIGNFGTTIVPVSENIPCQVPVIEDMPDAVPVDFIFFPPLNANRATPILLNITCLDNNLPTTPTRLKPGKDGNKSHTAFLVPGKYSIDASNRNSSMAQALGFAPEIKKTVFFDVSKNELSPQPILVDLHPNCAELTIKFYDSDGNQRPAKVLVSQDGSIYVSPRDWVSEVVRFIDTSHDYRVFWRNPSTREPLLSEPLTPSPGDNNVWSVTLPDHYFRGELK